MVNHAMSAWNPKAHWESLDGTLAHAFGLALLGPTACGACWECAAQPRRYDRLVAVQMRSAMSEREVHRSARNQLEEGTDDALNARAGASVHLWRLSPLAVTDWTARGRKAQCCDHLRRFV